MAPFSCCYPRKVWATRANVCRADPIEGASQSKMKPSKLLHVAFAAVWLVLASGCATVKNPPPVVDRTVDLSRFMGPWYVVAGQFTWLERNAYNGIESYELKPDGTIATTYTFRKGGFDGPLKTYRPSGSVFNRENNAEWRMQFLWPFKAAFLILYLDDEYRWTVIGEPTRKYLWIMAREPTIPGEIMEAITTRLAEIGYDTTKILPMPQKWPESSPR